MGYNQSQMSKEERMKWFKEAKLGIFIHWGIYSVLGVGESWSFFKGEISYEDYMKQLSGFTAAKYDPDDWADLFEKAGAKYAVLTTKHHDGVALWNTKASHLNVVEKTPAGRDLIGPYCDALRAHHMKVGLYFSHLDWSHPDYASIRPQSDDWWSNSPYNTPPEGQSDDMERWNRYLQFHKAQLTELLTQFGTVDLLWFDGVWERTPELWHFKEMNDYIRSLNPEIIINSRIGGYGDYKTPEQAMPVSAPDGVWEFCVTLNDSWGYQPQDNNYKSLRQLIRIFTECIGMGGNLLLDIGPKADGSIDERARGLLLGLGEWIHKNSEAVYQTERGLPPGLFFGNSTISKDKKTLFLFYYDLPSGPIALKGVRNSIRRISIPGHEASIHFTVNGGFERMPGIVWIDVPQNLCDPHCTVLQVDLDGELDLYTGQGGGIK